MQHVIKIALWVAVIGMVATAPALAGSKSYPQVTISGNTASGALGTARRMSGNQYIACAVYGSSLHVQCTAQMANGTAAYCVTPSNQSRAALTVSALNDDSYLEFGWDSSHTCTYIKVKNSSQYEPTAM